MAFNCEVFRGSVASMRSRISGPTLSSNALLRLIALGLVMVCACGPTVPRSRTGGADGLGASAPPHSADTRRKQSAVLALAARERRCRGGDAWACYLAGSDYRWGRGAAQNFKRAADFYRLACDTRSPRKSVAKACTDLGYLYNHGHGHGHGLKREPGKAIYYYRRGCDGGNALGCNNLGVLFDHGKHGVTRDTVRAMKLFQRACKGKSAIACSNLGLGYRKGRGLKRDLRRAQRLFVTACDGKGSAGCRHAGWGVLRGHGPKRDWRAALGYFIRGCDLARDRRDSGSCRSRDRMRGLEGALGVTSGAVCQMRGLWNPQGGRLVALGDAGVSRLDSVTFASLRWSSALMARVVIPRKAGAPPRVVLDDGRVRIRALVIPTRFGHAPRFYLAKQHRVSPVVWLAPGLRLQLGGYGSGVQATAKLWVVKPLGRRKMVFGLTCDAVSLHRPAWKRPANWPAGGPALGRRLLVRSAQVGLAAKPQGRFRAYVPKPGLSTGVLGMLGAGGKGITPRPTTTQSKRPPTLPVELLAKRGAWRRIRYGGHRYGFVAWVRGKVLRPMNKTVLGALMGGAGGLGLSGRGRRGGKTIRSWRCGHEVALSVRRVDGTTRRIGVLHPNIRFTVVPTKSAMVTIRIRGLRWLKLLPKAELVLAAKVLGAVCKKDR